MSFHSRTGSLVTLSNGNKTAQRRHAATEFNNGLVISSEPLRDNYIFEVKIDKKLNSWSGSLEIGVTTCEATALVFPPSATGLRDGTWVLSGTNVLKDGHSIREEYGVDLDTLGEGDCVGVMRTDQGALHFFVNSIDQGVAVYNLPSVVFAVVDLYGKCMQVSISNFAPVDNSRLNREPAAMAALMNSLRNCIVSCGHRLAFHEKCGSLVRLSNGGCTAERRRPMDEFNNGVVMTNRPLMPGELFEIRLDTLIDKWSGSIEVGITTHDPSELDFPATMTNMRSGTIMMSGCGILTNGKGTQREYGSFNLDELSEGDRIGVQRKPNGNLHFYINGRDQGIAADEAPELIWGVVDLYGMAIKVTLLHQRGDSVSQVTEEQAAHLNEGSESLHRGISSQLLAISESNSGHRLGGQALDADILALPNGVVLPDQRPAQPPTAVQYRGHSSAANSEEDAAYTFQEPTGAALMTAQSGPVATQHDRLRFHARCGRHVALGNHSRTASRLNPLEDFNDAVLLTHRCLRVGEVLEVQIDGIVDKWSGSLEIGVTLQSPAWLEFPSTGIHLRTGTWIMCTDGVVHNGVVIAADYGNNCAIRLQQLKVGDRVGVARKADGDLHFYINGIDQGCAARGVPADVYGVIDLYGQVAEASIIDSTTVCGMAGRDLCFYHRSGRNCSLTNDGRTASRVDARNEFNDAVVMSSRPLLDDELFEVVIDNTVGRWSGSIECGVTAIPAEDMVFPDTVTDLSERTWLWSGCSIMRDGVTIRNDYGCDLETLSIGSTVGIMRTGRGQLLFYVNGNQQGVACDGVPRGVYAVVDLYGQCAQVTITATGRHMTEADGGLSGAGCPLSGSLTLPQTTSVPAALSIPMDSHVSGKSTAVDMHMPRFSHYCGKSISLRNDGTTACRVRGYDHGTVFSADPVKDDELFEVMLEQTSRQWSGNLRIGLTTITVSENTSPTLLQPSATDLHVKGKVTWLVCGSEVKKNGVVIKENYATALERIDVHSRVGVKRAKDSSMHVFVDGEDLGIAATGLPRNVFAIVDLYGYADTVSVCSTVSGIKNSKSTLLARQSAAFPTSVSEVFAGDSDTGAGVHMQFHPTCHGRNIVLNSSLTTASRVGGYDGGVIFSKIPLRRNELFKVRIDRMNAKWSSSLMIGISTLPSRGMELPCNATMLTECCWLVRGNSILYNGCKVRENYCCDLESLTTAHSVGISIDHDGSLHVYINDVDQGIAAHDVVGCSSQVWHGVVDLYGGCEQLSIIDSAVPEYPELCPIDGREKADMETSAKEKGQKATLKACSYQNLCDRFRRFLGLPDEFFKPKFDRCFCDACWKKRSTAQDDGVLRDDEGRALPYCVSGSPPRRYALPLGWCRFGLRVRANAKTQKIFENWHMAFHGARPESVRRVLDSSDLLSIGNSADEGGLLMPLADDCEAEEEKNVEDAQDQRRQICVATAIQLAVGDLQNAEFKDDATGRIHKARLGFQLCIRPGSYSLASSRPPQGTIGEPSESKCDGRWVTKERGAVVILGLLIKIE